MKNSALGSNYSQLFMNPLRCIYIFTKIKPLNEMSRRFFLFYNSSTRFFILKKLGEGSRGFQGDIQVRGIKYRTDLKRIAVHLISHSIDINYKIAVT